MNKKSDRLRRWASLSALASAALAASSGSGEAAIIYHPFPASGPALLPGNNKINIMRNLSVGGNSTTSQYTRERLGPKGYYKTRLLAGPRVHLPFGVMVRAGGVGFRTSPGGPSGGLVALAKKGQTFGQIGAGVGAGLIGYGGGTRVHSLGAIAYYYGPRPHTLLTTYLWRPRHQRAVHESSRQLLSRRIYDFLSPSAGAILRSTSFKSTYYRLRGRGREYALFRFDVGSQTDYGWLELQLGAPSGLEPFIRIISYAYDTTGEPIKAGAIPEPAHLPLAVGAFALGAIGLREWRAKRKAAA